jgi:hypothetical protein
VRPCADTGRELKKEVTGSDQDHCSQILLQASPSLIRILQAIRFLEQHRYSPLSQIHFLLNFSWDALRMAICSLRSLRYDDEEVPLTKLGIVALDPTLFPVPFDLIMWDLACGSLSVMQQRVRGELNKYTLYVFISIEFTATMTIIQVAIKGMELLSESMSTIPQAVKGSRTSLRRSPELF